MGRASAVQSCLSLRASSVVRAESSWGRWSSPRWKQLSGGQETRSFRRYSWSPTSRGAVLVGCYSGTLCERVLTLVTNALD